MARAPYNDLPRLTPELVAAMRIEYAAGQVTQRQLAARYGADVMTISHALRSVS